MFYNCLKFICKERNLEEKKEKEISAEMIKINYKKRMDKYRPEKIIILKRRLTIYWFHKDNNQ
tara:strand:+ start:335 stop:523 length:189 start_codon:yes stop_codon:yes gene_type:complete